MTDAKTLSLELLAVIPDGDKFGAALCGGCGAEILFLHAFGMPSRYQGGTQIKDFQLGSIR